MKKVVLLAPYFLPRRRVGSWRPFKFAIHLKEFGWQPHIITIKDNSGTLTSKEQKLLEDIPIYEIEPPFDFTGQSGSSIDSGGQEVKKQNKENPFEPLLNWVDKNFPIDTWLPLFWLRKNQIQQWVSEIDPDVLWSTGDPWSSHWLADQITRETGIPWVADFRDPWTLGKVNLKERSQFSAKLDMRAERQVINNASALTFTSEATEELYRNHYPWAADKTRTLYNCFDLKLYDDASTSKQIQFNPHKLNLVFFGKFRRLSPAYPLIDILAELKKSQSFDDLSVEVHSFGPLSDEDEAYADERGVKSHFSRQAPVPAEQALQVLSQADLLWLSTNPDREHIIPAKLWDYLAAGQPILSIAPNPEIGKILDKTGTGIQIDPDNKDQVVRYLEKCILAKGDGKPLPIPAIKSKGRIKQYEAKEVTRRLASIFDQLS